MDLEYIGRRFADGVLKRNAAFSTTGYLNLTTLPEMLVFIKEEKYLPALWNNPNVSAVITTEEYSEAVLERTHCGVLAAKEPERLFYLIHNYLCRETDMYQKNDFKTSVGSHANISSRAVIADKNVVIGDGVIVEPGAVIMEGTQIGDNCVVGANTIIGTRGFQYYRYADEAFYIEHIGGVMIQNNVEILSSSCVASGLIVPTCLYSDVKLDNLVHIGHSACLDKRVLAAAGAIVAGSVYVGQRAWIGPNATISSSVHIGKDAFICLGAVVTKDVADGQKVSGNFAIDHQKQVEFIKSIR